METPEPSKAKLLTDLRLLQPGRSMVYHHGFLRDDRDEKSNRRAANWADVDEIGSVAYGLYLSGRVLLTQRRLGPPMVDTTGGVNEVTGLKTQVLNRVIGVGPGFEYIATGCDRTPVVEWEPVKSWSTKIKARRKVPA